MRKAHIIITAQGHHGDKVEQLRQGGQRAARVTMAHRSPDQSYKMLMAGRADFMLSTNSGWISLDASQKATLQLIEVDVWHENSGIATRTLTPEFIEQINQAIRIKLATGDTPCDMAAANMSVPMAD